MNKRERWPHPDAVRSWQGQIRTLLADLAMTQGEFADGARVSRSLVEQWLADPERTWHRTPDFLQKLGAIVYLKSCRNNRLQYAKRAKLSCPDTPTPTKTPPSSPSGG